MIVLPCGAGKTIVGMLCMDLLQTSTLVLTTCVTAVRQWIAELIDKTDIDPDLIGEYTGQKKEVRPVTVSTYQMLTHRGPSARPGHADGIRGRGGRMRYPAPRALRTRETGA